MNRSRLRPTTRARTRAVAIAGAAVALGIGPAAHAAAPTTVTLAGSFQSELGCSSDWAPDCAATHLTYDANSGVWKRAFTVPASPAGDPWQYEVAYDDSWNTAVYGAPGGGNAVYSQPSSGSVTFYFDPVSHWLTNSAARQIPVAAGSFQSELGCSADWAPNCLRSWLQDPDGDDVYEFSTTALPASSYETKIALNESWTANYGAGGVADGANIAFTVKRTGDPTRFAYRAATHVLTVQSGATPQPTPTPTPAPSTTDTPASSPSPSPEVTVAPTPEPAPAPSPVGSPPGPIATPRPAAAPIFTVARTQTDPKLASVRVAVRGAPAGAAITARLFRGTTLVGKRERKIHATSTATTFRVPLNARGRRLVRGSKTVRLTLRLTLFADGARTTTTQPVTLHR